MRRKNKKVFILLFSLVIISFLFLLNDTFLSGKEIRICKVSIIIRGKNSESWAIMKRGMELASSEMNVNISFVTLSEENSVYEQTKLIEREIQNGADAILISPVDYNAMKEPIENAIRKLPVVLIESTINTNEEIEYISCDNYKLGVSLAEEVIAMEGDKCNVAVVKNNLACSSINERYNGFMDTIKYSENTCTFWGISEEKDGYYNQINGLMKDGLVDVVVTFDTGMLELIGKVKKDLSVSEKENIPISIYGTGSTNKINSLLEDKIINATAMQNEFNVGYLGVKTAIDIINNKDIEGSTIYSTVINIKNMYSNENQRLLFPFVR